MCLLYVCSELNECRSSRTKFIFHWWNTLCGFKYIVDVWECFSINNKYISKTLAQCISSHLEDKENMLYGQIIRNVEYLQLMLIENLNYDKPVNLHSKFLVSWKETKTENSWLIRRIFEAWNHLIESMKLKVVTYFKWKTKRIIVLKLLKPL